VDWLRFGEFELIVNALKMQLPCLVAFALGEQLFDPVRVFRRMESPRCERLPGFDVLRRRHVTSRVVRERPCGCSELLDSRVMLLRRDRYAEPKANVFRLSRIEVEKSRAFNGDLFGRRSAIGRVCFFAPRLSSAADRAALYGSA